MWKLHRIRKHEVGLWFVGGDFKRLLRPGRRWVRVSLPVLGKSEVQVFDTLAGKFEHPLLKLIVDAPGMDARLEKVDLEDDQRALVWIDGRLGWVLGPGLHAFWRGPRKLRVERFSTEQFRFEHAKIEAVLAHPGAARFLDGVRVEAHERVLLFREGELVDQLGPGMYVFWKNAGKITWKSLDLREQVADVAGQEIMTADKVTLRVNLVVTYRVTDPTKAVTEVGDHAQTLYREAQLALREAVGARNLDRLLADKDQVGAEVRNALAPRAAEFGVAVRSVGLRDIILPGVMKVILNEVILAQKQAEANLIRRREETAAARSQANTAKLLAENPALARMKELEALQAILTGAKATFVLGKGDLSEQVRSLLGNATEPDDRSGDN
jgi:regulator of protease activity HflC (stomatin/prohibitin superfamily)